MIESCSPVVISPISATLLQEQLVAPVQTAVLAATIRPTSEEGAVHTITIGDAALLDNALFIVEENTLKTIVELTEARDYEIGLRITSDLGGELDTVCTLTVDPAIEDYSTWNYSRSITVKSVDGISENVNNLVVLVEFNQNNFDFSLASADAKDLRFAGQDNTPLEYVIDFWDADARQGAAWVLIPEYRPSTSSAITCYFGKDDVVTSSSQCNCFCRIR